MHTMHTVLSSITIPCKCKIGIIPNIKPARKEQTKQKDEYKLCIMDGCIIFVYLRICMFYSGIKC